MSHTTTKTPSRPPVKKTVIAGKSVTVATTRAAMDSSARMKTMYAKALDNLKNR